MIVSTPVGSTSHHPLQAHLWCWQASIKIEAKQFQSHLPFKLRAACCLQPPVPGLLKKSRSRQGNDRVGMIWLLENHQSTRAHMRTHLAEERNFVLDMD